MDLSLINIPETEIPAYGLTVTSLETGESKTFLKDCDEKNLFDVASLTKTIWLTSLRHHFAELIPELPFSEKFLSGYMLKFLHSNEFQTEIIESNLPFHIEKVLDIKPEWLHREKYSNLLPAWIFQYLRVHHRLHFEEDLMYPMLNLCSMKDSILYEGNKIPNAVKTSFDESRNGHVHDGTAFLQMKHHHTNTGIAGLFSTSPDINKFGVWAKNNTRFPNAEPGTMWWSWWKTRPEYPIQGWYFAGWTGCRLFIFDKYVVSFLSNAVLVNRRLADAFCVNIHSQLQ